MGQSAPCRPSSQQLGRVAAAADSDHEQSFNSNEHGSDDSRTARAAPLLTRTVVAERAVPGLLDQAHTAWLAAAAAGGPRQSGLLLSPEVWPRQQLSSGWPAVDGAEVPALRQPPSAGAGKAAPAAAATSGRTSPAAGSDSTGSAVKPVFPAPGQLAGPGEGGAAGPGDGRHPAAGPQPVPELQHRAAGGPRKHLPPGGCWSVSVPVQPGSGTEWR